MQNIQETLELFKELCFHYKEGIEEVKNKTLIIANSIINEKHMQHGLCHFTYLYYKIKTESHEIAYSKLKLFDDFLRSLASSQIIKNLKLNDATNLHQEDYSLCKTWNSHIHLTSFGAFHEEVSKYHLKIFISSLEQRAQYLEEAVKFLTNRL